MSSNERAAVTLAGAALALLAGLSAYAAVDLAALQVTPQRGQSSEQTRRDRYECHNWAVEQSGLVPAAAPVQDDRDTRADRARRAERINRVLNGAAIGAGIGGLIRATQDRDASRGVLAGAAVGAAVGAATASRSDRESDSPTDGEADYLRALSACLEGRGYFVALPEAPGSGEETVAVE